jgi:hypothetical protein
LRWADDHVPAFVRQKEQVTDFGITRIKLGPLGLLRRRFAVAWSGPSTRSPRALRRQPVVPAQPIAKDVFFSRSSTAAPPPAR